MDWMSTLAGGAIGFAASFGTMVAERIWNRAGRIKIYYVLKYGETPIETAGFDKADCGPTFVIPLLLEIQNTSNTSRVIRDVSARLYNNSVFVGEMIQINSSSRNNSIKNYGGEKNSYSFVIPPRSIQRQECTFVFTVATGETKKNIFNEVRIRYYDEHDITHEYHLLYIEDGKCWMRGNLDTKDEWTLLGKRKKYCPTEDFSGELIPFSPEKISYLQMIQEPISRMSNISAIMKGFAAAMTGVVATLLELEVSCWLLLMVSIPLFMFACLDIYYLKLEKKYRYLYECVRTDQHAVDFSMKLSKDNRKAKSRVIDCLKSTSIWLFYLVLFAALAAIVYLKWKGII